MGLSDALLGSVFILQTCVGFLGNSLLFSSYLYISLMLPRKRKPLDVILAHLTLANALALLLRGVPNTTSSFGVLRGMGPAGCKAVLYMQRVARSASLFATSLQSTFQAVTIAPGTCRWARLKPKVSAILHPSLLFFWLFNMAVYTPVIVIAVASGNATHAQVGYQTLYCKGSSVHYRFVVAFLSVVFIQDSFLLALVMCNSAYMASVLLRHRRATRRACPSRRAPENSATRVILMLASCFAVFYWINTFLTVYTIFTDKGRRHLEYVSNFIASCYPAICPFLLLKNENRIFRLNFLKARIDTAAS